MQYADILLGERQFAAVGCLFCELSAGFAKALGLAACAKNPGWDGMAIASSIVGPDCGSPDRVATNTAEIILQYAD